MSNQIDTFSTHIQNMVLYNIGERNARMAYDNTMLKLEANQLKK